MAIRERKNKGGSVFDVATFWNGRQYWELGVTSQKREAQRLDAQRKREVKAGTFVPRQKAEAETVADYGTSWAARRVNASAKDDARNLARFTNVPEFASLHMADVRPRHILAALESLKVSGGVKLKTLQNAYGTLRTMFRDARIAEVIGNDPCVLPRGYFEGDDSEERQPYQRTEAALLISHHAIPWSVRVLNALCLLAGLREGEACGRRWRDLDMGPEPLWALDVKTQYEGRKLKTRRTRVAPVHPELRAVLEQWGSVGFPQLMGRAPTPDDFIVPHRSNRSQKGHWTKSTYNKAFVRSVAAAGIPNRTLHSMRHTMVTLARRGGADKAVLTRVTHNPSGDIVDRYTHRDWSELCASVLAIGSLFSPLQSPPNLGGSGGISMPALPEQTTQNTAEHGLGAEPTRLQFPAPPPRKQHKTRHSVKGVQSDLQSPQGIPGDPLGTADADEQAFNVALGEAHGTPASRAVDDRISAAGDAEEGDADVG